VFFRRLNVATLKRDLSAYLRAVENGEEPETAVRVYEEQPDSGPASSRGEYSIYQPF